MSRVCSSCVTVFRYVKKHNMKHIRIHDLRHTCATLMINSGVDLKLTSTWLGHSSISITYDTYVKVVTDAKRQAAEKMSNSIFGKKMDSISNDL